MFHMQPQFFKLAADRSRRQPGPWSWGPGIGLGTGVAAIKAAAIVAAMESLRAILENIDLDEVRMGVVTRGSLVDGKTMATMSRAFIACGLQPGWT